MSCYDTSWFWRTPSRNLHKSTRWLKTGITYTGLVWLLAAVYPAIKAAGLLPAYGGTWFQASKGIHAAAAAVFLAHIFVSGVWMLYIVKIGDKRFVHRLAIFYNWMDLWCTAVPVVVIVATGLFQANMLAPMPEWPHWLIAGIISFLLSGAIWIGWLVPWQEEMILLSQPDNQDPDAPARFRRIMGLWRLWGIIAILLPLITYELMILRPAF